MGAYWSLRLCGNSLRNCSIHVINCGDDIPKCICTSACASGFVPSEWWCAPHWLDPVHCTIPKVLSFLKGLCGWIWNFCQSSYHPILQIIWITLQHSMKQSVSEYSCLCPVLTLWYYLHCMVAIWSSDQVLVQHWGRTGLRLTHWVVYVITVAADGCPTPQGLCCLHGHYLQVCIKRLTLTW